MSQFHIDLDVHDAEQLYAAALERAVQEKVGHQDAVSSLRPGGVIDAGACLVMLLDPGALPGVSINESWVDPL